VKVNDQGTTDPADDRIAGGARFEFRKDDGDGVYEPNGDDAPVLATVDARFGFAVFTPPAPGRYWVTEVSAPPGLEIAPPQLVTYTVDATPRNCTIVKRAASCVRDEDASGGFVEVVVADSPLGGGVLPATGHPTLPPTDSNPRVMPRSDVWAAVIGMLILFSLTLLALLGAPKRGRKP